MRYFFSILTFAIVAAFWTEFVTKKAGQGLGTFGILGLAFVGVAIAGAVASLIRGNKAAKTEKGSAVLIPSVQEDGAKEIRPVLDAAAKPSPFIESSLPSGETQEATGKVSPGVWALFAIGAVLFLLGHIGLIFGNPRAGPWAFLITSCIWAAIFGIGAYTCFEKKMRSGVTVVAALFFVAAGLDVLVEIYHRQALQQMLREGLLPPRPETQPKTVFDFMTDEVRERYSPEDIAAHRRFEANRDHIADSLGDYIGRHSFPFLSSIGNFNDTVIYTRAKERIGLGLPELNDREIVSVYEAQQRHERGLTWYKRTCLEP